VGRRRTRVEEWAQVVAKVGYIWTGNDRKQTVVYTIGIEIPVLINYYGSISLFDGVPLPIFLKRLGEQFAFTECGTGLSSQYGTIYGAVAAPLSQQSPSFPAKCNRFCPQLYRVIRRRRHYTLYIRNLVYLVISSAAKCLVPASSSLLTAYDLLKF
jgi:hypothetical protein